GSNGSPCLSFGRSAGCPSKRTGPLAPGWPCSARRSPSSLSRRLTRAPVMVTHTSRSSPRPDNRVNLAARDVTATRDLTTVVQGVGNAVLPTGQRAEIAHAVSQGPEERACVPISVPAATGDLPRVIDGYTDRAPAAECAEVQHSHG